MLSEQNQIVGTGEVFEEQTMLARAFGGHESGVDNHLSLADLMGKEVSDTPPGIMNRGQMH